jgi:hypothetical protein
VAPENPSSPSIDENQAKHQEMMAQGISIPVVIRSYTEKSAPGTVRLKIWTSKERTARSFKFWGMCWVIAICCVPLPIIHFTVLPLLLIAGPIGAWLISTQGQQILGGEGVCPDCGQFLPIAPGVDSWPLKDLCTRCQRALTIDKAE